MARPLRMVLEVASLQSRVLLEELLVIVSAAVVAVSASTEAPRARGHWQCVAWLASTIEPR